MPTRAANRSENTERDMRGPSIGIGVDGDGRDPHLPQGPGNPHGDLAPVRDQYFSEQWFGVGQVFPLGFTNYQCRGDVYTCIAGVPPSTIRRQERTPYAARIASRVAMA